MEESKLEEILVQARILVENLDITCKYHVDSYCCKRIQEDKYFNCEGKITKCQLKLKDFNE